MKQLGSDEARRKFRDLLDDAQRGESTEISRNGKPIAVLVPADPSDWPRTTPAQAITDALEEAAIADWETEPGAGKTLEIHVSQIAPIVERVLREAGK
jgi:prevent-host-death family protein